MHCNHWLAVRDGVNCIHSQYHLFTDLVASVPHGVIPEPSIPSSALIFSLFQPPNQHLLPLPLLYSSLAGLSTCVGAAVVFLVPDIPNNPSAMSLSLALSGSVMITVSLVSLLPEAFADGAGVSMEALLSLFLGCGLYCVLKLFAFPAPKQFLAPGEESSSIQSIETPTTNDESQRAWRVSMLLFTSLLCHNFPEGCAVAASTTVSPKLGWTTALAIALHNIPEGIAIAVPALKARPNEPWMAFGLASLSGLAEPLGAVATLAMLENTSLRKSTFSTPEAASLIDDGLLSFVAGIMMTVAILELFPEAMRHSENDPAPLVVGTLLGIGVMLATETYLHI
jgi:zinc transporter, ZIP family